MQKRFGDLKPGDLFVLDPEHIFPVRGVCVIEPKVVRVERRGFLWLKRVEIAHAVCIELHPYQGAVEWNPEESVDLLVDIEEVKR